MVERKEDARRIYDVLPKRFGKYGLDLHPVKMQIVDLRRRRAMKAVSLWCRRNRHRPVREQHRYQSLVMRGHCGYYGITGNSSALKTFRKEL